MDFPCGSAVKESACSAGGLGSVPGSGRSPGEGKGYPLQRSDSIVRGFAKSRTCLNDFHLRLKAVVVVVAVQSLISFQLFGTSWTAACHAPLFFAISQSVLKLMSVMSVVPSNHLILRFPLLLLLSIFPSIRVFSNESLLHIRFSIIPSNKYLELISFRADWFDLLAGQGTLKSLLQNHSSKTFVLQCSAFFVAQRSYPYMILEKP